MYAISGTLLLGTVAALAVRYRSLMPWALFQPYPHGRPSIVADAAFDDSAARRTSGTTESRRGILGSPLLLIAAKDFSLISDFVV